VTRMARVEGGNRQAKAMGCQAQAQLGFDIQQTGQRRLDARAWRCANLDAFHRQGAETAVGMGAFVTFQVPVAAADAHVASGQLGIVQAGLVSEQGAEFKEVQVGEVADASGLWSAAVDQQVFELDAEKRHGFGLWHGASPGWGALFGARTRQPLSGWPRTGSIATGARASVYRSGAERSDTHRVVFPLIGYRRDATGWTGKQSVPRNS